MAGRFVEDSMLDMGSLNPHGRFVHVYLNGVYWGQYDCRELLVEHFLADYLGGAAEDYVAVRGNDNVGDDFVLGTPEPPNLQPWEPVRAYRTNYNLVRAYLDVPHLIDFMLLWNYGNCESEYRSCGPIAAGTGFKFWIADADGFLRTSAMGLNRTVRNGPGDVLSGLVAENHSDFKTLLADRIYQHFFNNGALTPARNDARLAARMQEIHDSLLAECARWGYRTPANWESAAATIRSNLFPSRTTQLIGYLRSAGSTRPSIRRRSTSIGGLVTNGFQPHPHHRQRHDLLHARRQRSASAWWRHRARRARLDARRRHHHQRSHPQRPRPHRGRSVVGTGPTALSDRHAPAAHRAGPAGHRNPLQPRRQR